MDGAIIVDKPSGWTSHDAVARIRRLAGTRRVGHLGTLDPMATGVLPIVIERGTRLSQFYVKSEKVYEAVIRFGFSTDTYDREGTPTSPETDFVIGSATLDEALDRFRGTFQQTPPPVSAKSIGGVRAYKMPREQAAAQLKPVEVHITEAVILGVEGRDARVRVACSGGTYLRAIAHELGQALGCGAHLQELRRTRSGEFSVDRAHSIEELEELTRAGRLEEVLIPAARLLPDFPAEFVDEITEAQIRHGRDFAVSPFHVKHGARYVKALNRSETLVAIGEIRLPNLYHPFVVF